MADEYDWKVALDTVSDTESINGSLNAAVNVLYLFIQGQREVLGLA
jgi:hypothetical protein